MSNAAISPSIRAIQDARFRSSCLSAGIIRRTSGAIRRGRLTLPFRAATFQFSVRPLFPPIPLTTSRAYPPTATTDSPLRNAFRARVNLLACGTIPAAKLKARCPLESETVGELLSRIFLANGNLLLTSSWVDLLANGPNIVLLSESCSQNSKRFPSPESILEQNNK